MVPRNSSYRASVASACHIVGVELGVQSDVLASSVTTQPATRRAADSPTLVVASDSELVLFGGSWEGFSAARAASDEKSRLPSSGGGRTAGSAASAGGKSASSDRASDLVSSSSKTGGTGGQHNPLDALLVYDIALCLFTRPHVGFLPRHVSGEKTLLGKDASLATGPILFLGAPKNSLLKYQESASQREAATVKMAVEDAGTVKSVEDAERLMFHARRETDALQRDLQEGNEERRGYQTR